MDKSPIKSILLSKGWNEIEKELKKGFSDIEISEKGGVSEIGKCYLAKAMAIKALDKVLVTLNKIKDEEIKEKTVYR